MNIIYTLKTKKESKQSRYYRTFNNCGFKKESITLASTAVSVKVTETEADAETELPKTSGAETKAETTTTVIFTNRTHRITGEN